MAIKTNKSDVIANFVRYHGRQPNDSELKTGGLIEYLTTKAPKEVETLLSKNSPITGGKLWADYQASLKQTPIKATPVEVKKATLYNPKTGSPTVVEVGSSRASQLQNQGYTLSKPVIKKIEKATLYNPTTGEAKVVEVGSSEASNLQNKGYTLNKPTIEEKKIEPKVEPKTEPKTETKTEPEEDLLSKLPQEVSDRIYEAFNRLPSEQDAKNYNYNPDLFNRQIDDAIAKIEADKVAEEDKVKTEEEKVKTAEDQANMDNAISLIDEAVKAGTLPPDLAEMYKEVVKNYPPGVEFEAQEILNTFEKVKNETIDPYFKELADVAKQDIQYAYGLTEASRERELEAERTTAGQNIRQVKEGLEKSGMTFTGQGIEKLGAESAYAQKDSEGNVLPTQTPFGGQFYEGTTNQANRLLASSSSARYGEALQSLGRSAEDYLGSEGAGALGIPYQSAGVNKTGSLENQKQGQYGSKLQQIINNYRQKQTGLEDIQFTNN